MSLTVLLLTLLLSLVVLETDSCTSITGWKLRHIDVEHKEPKIEIEMTTKTIKIDSNHNNNKNMSRMQRFITEPIILQIGEEPQRCEKEFEQAFCHNHGKCIKTKIPGSFDNEKAHCVCDSGYTDSRCMTKLPDFDYRTIKDRSDLNRKDPSTSSTVDPLNETKKFENFGDKIQCPEPFDQDFCIHGQCFTFSNLNGNYFCLCHDDYSGIRCEMKATDHYYETKRIRRHLQGSRRKKYKINPKFRQLT